MIRRMTRRAKGDKRATGLRALAITFLFVCLAVPAVALACTCGPTGTVIMCSTADGAGYSFAKAPRRCFVDWDPRARSSLPLSSAIDLRDLHWSRWGNSRAYARAKFRDKVYDPWTRVRVVADRLVRPEGPGYRAYGRLRVTFPDGHTQRWSLPTLW